MSSVADLSEIVFMGDFNLDPVNSAGNFRFFNESVNFFNLSLVESGPIRIIANSSITLDRFVVSDLDRVRELSIVSIFSIADHELVILDLDYVRTFEEPIVRYFRDKSTHKSASFGGRDFSLTGLPWSRPLILTQRWSFLTPSLYANNSDRNPSLGIKIFSIGKIP
jgi:hypothetical protein